MSAIEEIRSIVDGLKEQVNKKYDEFAQKSTEDGEKLKAQHQAELKALDDRLATLEKRISDNPANVPGLEFEKDKWSWERAFQAIHSGRWDYAGFERECFDAVSKDHTAGDGTKGAYTVPVQLSGEIVELVMAQLSLYDMGITMINDMPPGVYDIPTQESRPDAGAVSENESLSELSYTFGNHRAQPHRVGGYSIISKRLIRNAVPDMEAFIKMQLSKSMAVKVHKLALVGTGSNDEPRGLLLTPNMSSVSGEATNGKAPTAQALLEMRTDLEESDFDTLNRPAGYLMRPITLEGLQCEKVQQYTGQTSKQGYVFSPPLVWKNELEEKLRAKIGLTTHIGKTTTKGSATDVAKVIFSADWSNFLMMWWAGIDMSTATEISTSAGSNIWLKNQIAAKVEGDFDVVNRYPVSFVVRSDLRTTRSLWA